MFPIFNIENPHDVLCVSLFHISFIYLIILYLKKTYFNKIKLKKYSTIEYFIYIFLPVVIYLFILVTKFK